MRVWFHFVLITVSGLVNLFYGGIVPFISDAMNAFNEQGTAFFQDTSLWLVAGTLLTGVPHLAYAITSLVVSLASLDALKERLMDWELQNPS